MAMRINGRWGGAALCLAVTVAACAPKGSGSPTQTSTSQPGYPTPFPSINYGPVPAAELASLPVQPKSGTWEVTGKTPDDKVTPFQVVLEFQPNGLIKVNGSLMTDAQAAKDPYNRSYVSRPVTLGQVKTQVVFQLGGGQYTLTLTAADRMAGVGLIHGEVPAGVNVAWVSDSTATPH